MFRPFPVLAAVLLPTAAFAQAVPQDQEYGTVEVAPKDKVLETHLSLESAYHAYNNLDFRKVDESSDQSILDTDDRNAFAFTGIAVNLAYAPVDDLEIDIGVSHRGLWGNDQIGNVNAFGGFVYVTSLAVDWTPNGRSTADKDELTVRVGRQFLSIGATPAPDFVLADIIDGVRVDIPVGPGRFILIPYSMLSSSGDNANANFFSYIGQSSTQNYGFRGDHITSRIGGIFALDRAVTGLDVRAHFFYTDIGSLGSGSDISYDGMLGNFADNDYVGNYGVRGQYGTGPVKAYAEFDGSFGIDRKELVAQDVDTNGFAWGGGVAVDTSDDESLGFVGSLDYFEALGPLFTRDGLQASHGYVSMKGNQVGGLVANRFLGWHPSAYVGMFGIDDNQQDTDRKSGTRSIHAGAGVDAERVGVKLDAWYMQDTGVTGLNVADLDSMTPPYGYSREEFAAEERLGKPLGVEVDATVNVRANDHLSFIANAGILNPGSYYKIPIGRIAGDQLGAETLTPAYAWNVGTVVEF